MDGQMCRIEQPGESGETLRADAAILDLHGSVAARGDAGVLILGAPGSGKSDLVLRLIDRGWSLVADDRVRVQGGWAEAAPALAGLLEVRGLGILRLERVRRVLLRLVVSLGQGERLPGLERHDLLDLPLLHVDPERAASPQIIEVALRTVLGEQAMLAGAFA